MTRIAVARGVMKSPVFRGLTKTYVAVAAGAGAVGFFLILIVGNWGTILGLCVGLGVAVLGFTIASAMSAKFGERGLSQYRAAKSADEYVACRMRLGMAFANNRYKQKKVGKK